MMMRLVLALSFLLTTHAIAGVEAVDVAATVATKTTGTTARDLKTIGYVENAHGQLDEWARRLLARTERGLGPREREPLLDGRARLQVAKLRVTYAGYTHSASLAAAIHALADAHEARLMQLEKSLAGAADPQAVAVTSDIIDGAIAKIRNWRTQ